MDAANKGGKHFMVKNVTTNCEQKEPHSNSKILFQKQLLYRMNYRYVFDTGLFSNIGKNSMNANASYDHHPILAPYSSSSTIIKSTDTKNKDISKIKWIIVSFLQKNIMNFTYNNWH